MLVAALNLDHENLCVTLNAFEMTHDANAFHRIYQQYINASISLSTFLLRKVQILLSILSMTIGLDLPKV